MEDKKFRNHIFVLAEGMGSLLLAVFLLLINLVPDIIGDWDELESISIDITSVFIVIGVAILIVAIYVAWRVRVWYKTWFTIKDGVISEERNTFFYKKNSVGIKNISNVNLEQNIVEMIFGIKKLKINTDSSSTSDTTDMKIILKKDDALKLKDELNNAIELLRTGTTYKADVSKEETEQREVYDIVSTPKEIIAHSFYAINLGAIVAFVSVIGGAISVISDMMSEQDFAAKVTVVIAIIAFVGLLLGALAAQMLSVYLKMANFATKRSDDKLYIKYGIIKQVDYSIPVSRINSVIIKQSFIARILHKYSVEIVNIGLGDEEKENTCLCFYTSKENIQTTMNKLLPEFADNICFDIVRQPKAYIAYYCCYSLIAIAIVAVIDFVIAQVDVPAFILIPITLVILALYIIRNICAYCVRGSVINGDCIVVRTGAFSCKYQFVELKKIQHIQFNRSFIMKKLNMTKGIAFILAKTLDSIVELPYSNASMEETLKDKIQKQM